MGLWDEYLPQNNNGGVPVTSPDGGMGGIPNSGGFGVPSGGFGTSDVGFGVPSGGFGTPNVGFGAPSGGFDSYGGMSNVGYDNFGGYNNYGSVDRFGNVKYSRAEILDGLRNYVTMNTGRSISYETKIEETPNLLRHACAEAKVSFLAPCVFQIPEMQLQFQFYFCTACGALFYPAYFM